MTILFYLFIAFLSLSVLVFFHELGHYTVAKFFGVKIESFNIGFGKVLARKHCCDTVWAFRALPLGGYVHMKGQNDANPLERSSDPDSYDAKKPWQRIIISLAGPFANLVLAFFVYLLIAMSGAPAIVAADYLPTVVSHVEKGSPAQDAGVAVGDKILKVNHTAVTYWYEVGALIRNSTGEISLEIQRNGTVKELKLGTKTVDGTNQFQEAIKKRIIGINTAISKEMTIEFSPMQSLFYAWNETKKATTMIAMGTKKMATGEIDSKNVGGALTIFDVIMKFAERGIIYLLFVMALISVNLGVLNLLPIPALDGGHIMFNLYEIITRREPSEAALYYLTLLGWALLFGLMGLGLYNDINRIWG